MHREKHLEPVPGMDRYLGYGVLASLIYMDPGIVRSGTFRTNAVSEFCL